MKTLAAIGTILFVLGSVALAEILAWLSQLAPLLHLGGPK